MHAEDEAFVRVIRERPDDDAARLVYADWLDERDDPRAAYLRAEAEWAALRPADEQYRPLYRRVSQLAAGLKPEWFAAVSRIASQVRQTLKALPNEFKQPPVSTHNRRRLWEEAGNALDSVFVDTFGRESATQRFYLPADFLALECVIDCRPWWCYDCEQLVALATDHLQELGPLWTDSGDELPARNPEMWLQFGQASDDSWFFVCCDLGSPLFGVIAEGAGDHPSWEGSQSLIACCGRNVLHFLGSYLTAAYGPNGYNWPAIPFSEWATH